jgi:hypothetical protein
VSYTLDDAHEALSMVWWCMENDWAEDTPGVEAVLAALAAIEAQLPEPCPNCGDDDCPWLVTTSAPGDACENAARAMFSWW